MTLTDQEVAEMMPFSSDPDPTGSNYRTVQLLKKAAAEQCPRCAKGYEPARFIGGWSRHKSDAGRASCSALPIWNLIWHFNGTTA